MNTPYTKYLLMALEIMDNRPDIKNIEFKKEHDLIGDNVIDVTFEDGSHHLSIAGQLRSLKSKN